jgi:hypothetical protein
MCKRRRFTVERKAPCLARTPVLHRRSTAGELGVPGEGRALGRGDRQSRGVPGGGAGGPVRVVLGRGCAGRGRCRRPGRHFRAVP